MSAWMFFISGIKNIEYRKFILKNYSLYSSLIKKFCLHLNKRAKVRDIKIQNKLLHQHPIQMYVYVLIKIASYLVS